MIKAFMGCTLVTQGIGLVNYDDIRYSLLVFDDVGSALRTGPGRLSFERLLINKRHRRNSVIILIQAHTFLPPVLRTNKEFVYAFRFESMRMQKVLYEEFFLQWFESFTEFSTAMRRLDKYDFLLTDTVDVARARVGKILPPPPRRGKKKT